MVEICKSVSEKTKCNQCNDGYYAEKPNTFDRCNPCRSCQQVYAEKCTSTANAKCSCRKGFLCSNEDCSTCAENKCPAGEQMTWTDTLEMKMSNRTYQCKLLCQPHEYFDEEDDVCKTRTQCSALGLNEEFPGNKTHNSRCTPPGTNVIYWLLGIGFVLLSLTLLVFMTHSFIKYHVKHRASKLSKTNSFHGDIFTEVCADGAVFTKASDAQLSQEECGIKLIIMDESISGSEKA